MDNPSEKPVEDINSSIIDLTLLPNDSYEIVKNERMAVEEKETVPIQIIDDNLIQRTDVKITKTSESPELNILANPYTYTPSYICPYCGTKLDETRDGSTFTDTISKHLAKHHKDYFQCFICNKTLNTEAGIMNHMFNEHPYEMIHMYHNSSSTLSSNTIEIITSHVECGVCLALLSTPYQAAKHFSTFHLSQEFKMQAIQMIKTITHGLAPNWSIGDNKWPLKPMMICLRCHVLHLTVTDMIKHHNDKHPLTFIAIAKSSTLGVVPYNNDAKFIELNADIAFCCIYCQDEDKVPSLYNNAKDVFVHWNDAHVKNEAARPFRFYVEKLMECFYCNIITTFNGLQAHFQEAHPTVQFACCSIANQRKCGICDSSESPLDSIPNHFKRLHSPVLHMNIFNPFRLVDELFDELLAINVNLKVECTHQDCDKVFNSSNDLQKHTFDHHFDKWQHSHCQTFRDLTVETFVDCCKRFLNPIDYLQHLNDHVVQGVCSRCPFSSTTVSIVAEHEYTVHGVREAFLGRYMEYLRVCHINYWQTKVIFGNGLVLFKYNLLSSKIYNDRKEFDAMINAKMEIENETYKELIQNGTTSSDESLERPSSTNME